MPPAVGASSSEAPVMGHGDFGGNASSAFFPPPPPRNHFNKPTDVSLTSSTQTRSIPFHSGVAGPLAARGGGQICRPFVLGF